MKKLYLRIAIALILLVITGTAGSQTKKKLAIMPFHSIGVDAISIKSSESLLRMEIEKLNNFVIIPESNVKKLRDLEPPVEIPEAVEAGNKLNADNVLLCKFVALGEKIIVQYTLLDVPSEKVLLLDQANSITVEDLDAVMKRIAMSITSLETIEKTAEVGAIIDDETFEPRRRMARKFGGFSFGYVYPQHGYDGTEKSFSVDFRTGAELKNYSIGMVIAARKGFAMNVFANYLMSKKDFCPYIGGAFGFHWVSHNRYTTYDYNYTGRYEEMEDDGFEITANAGFKAFRTYNFQILVNLAYSYTLNDYDDKAFVFTIGFLR